MVIAMYNELMWYYFRYRIMSLTNDKQVLVKEAPVDKTVLWYDFILPTSAVDDDEALVSASSMSGLSPQPTKLGKPPLKTLLEEQYVRETKPLLREPSEEVCCVITFTFICAIKILTTRLKNIAIQNKKSHMTNGHCLVESRTILLVTHPSETRDHVIGISLTPVK